MLCQHSIDAKHNSKKTRSGSFMTDLAKAADIEEDFLTVAARKAFSSWEKADLLKIADAYGVHLNDKTNLFQIVLDLVKWRIGENFSDEQLFATLALRSECCDTTNQDVDKFDPARDLMDFSDAKSSQIKPK